MGEFKNIIHTIHRLPRIKAREFPELEMFVRKIEYKKIVGHFAILTYMKKGIFIILYVCNEIFEFWLSLFQDIKCCLEAPTSYETSVAV